MRVGQSLRICGIAERAGFQIENSLFGVKRGDFHADSKRFAAMSARGFNWKARCEFYTHQNYENMLARENKIVLKLSSGRRWFVHRGEISRRTLSAMLCFTHAVRTIPGPIWQLEGRQPRTASSFAAPALPLVRSAYCALYDCRPLPSPCDTRKPSQIMP